MTSAAEKVSLYWPLLLYALLVVVIVGAMVGISALLGQRHKDRQTGEPYESGILPTGAGRPRVNVRYYIVAVFFVVFDLEAAFIFAWAVAFREAGWPGYAGLAAFAGILLVLLLYEGRTGALDYVTRVRRTRAPGSRAEGEARS
jgi:NADH-quinone oxidoreductase subunit A